LRAVGIAWINAIPKLGGRGALLGILLRISEGLFVAL
jgi:hypothetical protein